MEFKDRIRELRNERNLTQQQLADELYLSRGTISKWETGLRYPGFEELVMLSEYFHVSIDSLLSKEDEINRIRKEPVAASRKSSLIQMMLLSWQLIFFLIRLLLHLLVFPRNAGAVMILSETITSGITAFFIVKCYRDEITPENIILFFLGIHGLELLITVYCDIRYQFFPLGSWQINLLYLLVYYLIPAVFLAEIVMYFVGRKTDIRGLLVFILIRVLSLLGQLIQTVLQNQGSFNYNHIYGYIYCISGIIPELLLLQGILLMRKKRSGKENFE